MVIPIRSRTPVITRVILVAIALVVLPARARADSLTDLVKQLKSGSDEKIRLSAALGLQKLGDQRGVEPLVDALKDSDRNVRAAAAIGLGRLVTVATKADVKKKAIVALDDRAKNDSSSLVQKKAKEASAAITALGTGTGTTITTTTTTVAGGVFVDIGPMAAPATDPKLKDVMRKMTLGTFGKSAKSMATTWPGGKAPTASQLSAKGVQGFHVDGTVVEVKSSGGTVSCKISMLIASFPEKSMFAFLKGGASVSGGGASTSELDKADCVSAVIEDMVMKKIIPTIKTKAGIP